MRSLLIFTILLLVSSLGTQRVALEAPLTQPTAPPQMVDLKGRWKVKFNLSGIGEKNLVLESKAGGVCSFLLPDAGVDSKPLPASWSQTTNDRVNFSGEAELPLGTCCLEIGTLIFKGKFKSNDSISGRAIFIGSTQDEENFNGFRTMVGTFIATRDSANH